MNNINEYLEKHELFASKEAFNDHGKVRVIVTYNAPRGYELREEHECILSHELELLPSSRLSYAYKQGVKLLDAVKPHLGNITFMKLDIKGFFDHIDCELLSKKIKDYGIDVELRYCFYQGKLPIGFVTSPKLSDFYLYDLDKAVERYLKDHPGLVYSRYADDFLLSSPSEDFEDVDALGTFIQEELMKCHLELNEEKTLRASLNKQTSVRFLGLNIGKDKITLSKWYILKTLNAFKRFHIARYNGADNVDELKSIAYGLYNFIEQNSKSSKQRFLKKYHNTFHEPFRKELKSLVQDGVIDYKLNRNTSSYTAILTNKIPKRKLNVLYFKDRIDGAPVVSVKNECYEYYLENVQRINLPAHLVTCHLPFSHLTSLTKNPIMDIVNVQYLKAKKDVLDYQTVLEVGFVHPSCNDHDYYEDIYSIKKVSGGYEAEVKHNGTWGVSSLDRFEKSRSYFVSSSKLADQLFDYLAEQVTVDKKKMSRKRYSYVNQNGMQFISPSISLKQIAAAQFFFKEVLKLETKYMKKNSVLTDDHNAKKLEKEHENYNVFEAILPYNEINKTQISLSLDFVSKKGMFVSSFTVNDHENPDYRSYKESKWDFLKDDRIKELMITYINELDEFDEKHAFKFSYLGKSYGANSIKTSFYHLLQFISPIEFKLNKAYLIDDGEGEYLFAGCGEERIPDSAYMGCDSLRVIRIGGQDIYLEVGDEAFKGCKNLETVYISRNFYAFRLEHQLHFGKNVFFGADKLNGNIIGFPLDDDIRYSINDKGRLDWVRDRLKAHALPEGDESNDDDISKSDYLSIDDLPF